MANQCLLRETRAVLITHSLNGSHQSSKEVIGNHQLESRMREIRTYGSEGGAVQTNALSLPLFFNCYLRYSKFEVFFNQRRRQAQH